MLPEAVVQRVFLARAAALPGVHLDRINVVVARRYHRAIRSAPDGFPDAIGVVHGRAQAVEFKAPGRVQSPAQIAWQKKWVAAGGLYLLVQDPEAALDGLRIIVAMNAGGVA